MSGVRSFERMRARIAAGASLMAGGLAMYWLIEILRRRVPDIGAHDVEIGIALLSILAVAFGLVARRPFGRITYAPLIVAPWASGWAAHFHSKWSSLPTHDLGQPEIVTCVVTCGGLFAAALLVREPWRRSAAQPAVAADEASPRR